MLRILHVITTINLGGAENHLFNLVKKQHEKGLDVEVVYLKGDHFWRQKLEELGIRCHCLNIDSYLKIPLKTSELRNLILTFEPHIVHSHMPPAELLCTLCFKRYPRLRKSFKYICTKHNDERFAPIPGEKWLGQFCFKDLDGLISISNAVQDFATSQFHFSEEQISKRIYYGVDTSHFLDASQERVAHLKKSLKHESDFLIGTVARLTAQKSLETLIKSTAILRDRFDTKVRLVIVGEGELREQLESLVSDLKLESQVDMPGKKDNISEYMHAFDIFALPSIYEGLGLVLLEAQACGTPIVASKVSAIPEIVKEHAGILVEPKNENALALSLKQALDNLDQYDKSLIINETRKRFSLDVNQQETFEFYNQVINMKPACKGQYVRD